MISFVSSPLKSGFLFSEVFKLEKTQIILDNSAILIARHDRLFFHYVVKMNKILKNLERIHHYWHTCAKIPKTAMFCRPKDIMMETKILEFVSVCRKNFDFMWAQSLREGLDYLSKHQVNLKLILRPSLPVKFVLCEFCNLPTKMILETQKLKEPTFLLSQGSLNINTLIYNLGQSLDSENWNYRLGDINCEK